MVVASDVMPKIPKNTPLWAVGIVSIAASFALCLGAMYIVIRPEVQTYLAAGYKIQDRKVDSDAVIMSNILNIVKASADQVSSLSASLALAQATNIRLTARVEVLEKEVSDTKATLKEYEIKFKELRGK